MCEFELAKRVPANSKMTMFGKLYLLVLNQLKGGCSKHFFRSKVWFMQFQNYLKDFSAFLPQPIPILFIIWFYILIWPHIYYTNKLVPGRAPRCSSISIITAKKPVSCSIMYRMSNSTEYMYITVKLL